MNRNNYLVHWGIKGQKWGNRRYQYEDGSLTPEGKERYRKVSDVRQLTDKDLADVVNRMRLEKEYASLSAAQKQSSAEKVEKTLARIGNMTASAAKIASSAKVIKKVFSTWNDKD